MNKKPKIIEIEIPYLPISLNRIIRMKRVVIRKYYRKCKEDVQWLAIAGRLKPKKPFEKAKMTTVFVFPNNRAVDLDNMIGGQKGITDGIKAAGIIEDDSWQKLELEFRGERGKEAKTRIIIEEIK